MGDNEANFLDNLALNLIIVPYNYSDLDVCVRTVVNFYYIYLWFQFTNIIMTIICSVCFLLLVFDWKYIFTHFSCMYGSCLTGVEKVSLCDMILPFGYRDFFSWENWKGLVDENWWNWVLLNYLCVKYGWECSICEHVEFGPKLSDLKGWLLFKNMFCLAKS
jgi:hypothetical protein